MWPFRNNPESGAVAKSQEKPLGPVASVSSICIENCLPVMHAVRMEMTESWHSGWVLDSGRESPEFSKDARNYKPVALELMIETDGTLAPLRDWPVGTEVARFYVTKNWDFITRDKDGQIVGASKHEGRHI